MSRGTEIKVKLVLGLVAVLGCSFVRPSLVGAGAAPIDVTRGVNEGGYVRIGGIDQWVQIRGDDRSNPVLLWLSGGPGFSTIPATAGFRSWEAQFTVVMWDQRGEGKTFERSGTSVAPTMTIGRMTEDGIQLAQYLRLHLHQQKIILLGHSWGSMLGIHMIAQRPDLFSAYVGTGQVVNLERDAEAAYPLLLARARAMHNTLAVQQLEAAGPPPYSGAPNKWVWVRWANELDPITPEFAAVGGALRSQPAYISEGAAFSQGLMWESLMGDDLPRLGLDFHVPVIFIQGAEDGLTVTALAREYFERIRAPRKRFIVLPNVGHLAVLTARQSFLEQLVEWVRPLALENHP